MGKKLITATIIVLCLLISASAFSQQKQDAKQPSKDSLQSSTVFLSVADIYKFSEPLKDKVTARQYEIYLAVLQEMINNAAQEWYKNKQAKK